MPIQVDFDTQVSNIIHLKITGGWSLDDFVLCTDQVLAMAQNATQPISLLLDADSYSTPANNVITQFNTAFMRLLRLPNMDLIVTASPNAFIRALVMVIVRSRRLENKVLFAPSTAEGYQMLVERYTSAEPF